MKGGEGVAQEGEKVRGERRNEKREIGKLEEKQI